MSMQSGNGDRPSRSVSAEHAAAVEVLERLAAAADVAFDHAAAVRAWEHAVTEFGGAMADTWAARLARAGRELGLNVDHVRRAPRDAIGLVRPGGPVAVFAPNDVQPHRWLLLRERRGNKVCLAATEPGERDEWVDALGLMSLLNLSSGVEPTDWIIASPATPLAGASARAADAAAFGPAPHAHGHDGHGAHPTTPPFRRLRQILKPDKGDIWAIFGFAVAVGLLSLAVPVAVQQLVTTIAFGSLLQPVVFLGILLAGVLVFAAILRAIQTYVVEILQRRIFVRVVADLANRLPRVRIDAFDRHHGPELVNRFFDVMTIQKATAGLLLDGVAIALQALIGLLILAFYHPVLLGFDVVLLVVISLIVFGPMRRAVRTAIAESRAKYDVASWMEELARHPIAFKLAGGPLYARAQADSLTRNYLAHRKSHFRVLMGQIVASLGLQVVANTALLVIGGALVIGGELSLGQLIASELIVTVVVSTFSKFGKHLESFYDLMAATDKIGHLIDLPLERTAGDGHRETSPGAGLRIRDVSFGYDQGPPVLRNVNIDIPRGARVAITGPSGSGKSTLIELLYGLRTPTAGHVELDGADLRDIRLESLREHVATVKGFEVIEGTVLENVRMGRSNISIADVREVLKAVELIDDVQDFPDGLNAYLSSGGAPLSVGQARRLMLARAIVGRPRLLILDEALEGLDEEVRPRVIETLFDRGASWTLVVVTHAPDLASRCDQVFTLPRVPRDQTAGPVAAAGH